MEIKIKIPDVIITYYDDKNKEVAEVLGALIENEMLKKDTRDKLKSLVNDVKERVLKK